MAGECRLGHETRHFNIGQYRRAQSQGKHESHNADFFDPSNSVSSLPLQPGLHQTPSLPPPPSSLKLGNGCMPPVNLKHKHSFVQYGHCLAAWQA